LYSNVLYKNKNGEFSMKKHLKILALTTSMLFGLTATQAAELRMGDGTVINAGDAIAAAEYLSVIAWAGASFNHTAGLTTQANQVLNITTFDDDGASSMALTQSGAVTLADGLEVFLHAHDAVTPKIIFSGAVGPDTVTDVLFGLGGAVSLPDMTAFTGVTFSPLRDVTLTVATGIGSTVEIPSGKTLTIATATTLSGKVTGAGILVAGSLTAITGNLREFTGEINTPAGALTITTPPIKATLRLNDQIFTLSQKGSVRSVISGHAAATLVADEDLVIEELDVSAQAVELRPAAGKRIVIKKITGNNNITCNGAGKIKVTGAASSYTGNLVSTTGSFEY
jgi:hypothetical protein